VVVAPAEARRIAGDYVVKRKALHPGAKVRVSDFGKPASDSYPVPVDMTIHTRGITRYRVKMDKNGNITSFTARENRNVPT
jgi:hypothetical protein